ncbi:hypothetical protein AKJ50_00485 [candidate division MSBL1 archaeon SCGC-AAA382A13]|uniref:SpoVT-AbrB domain-containing protein n=1 Tax=candidate division MSBL1 archaeon SCGC-AAA382A13 TaxID=1698279 RepID=A0A133VGQ3_9EURY|nr:hypothetical protein AKJ50_00485 [candidate division MSBL1 archaeon SCGC-AAA382A13]
MPQLKLINMSKTVKARVHHGADSLNLTIPADIVREHEVNDGDIFEIEVKEVEENLVIEYKRVYCSE